MYIVLIYYNCRSSLYCTKNVCITCAYTSTVPHVDLWTCCSELNVNVTGFGKGDLYNKCYGIELGSQQVPSSTIVIVTKRNHYEYRPMLLKTIIEC